MNYKKDYYSILGVDEKATSEELRDSYRRLAKLHHPDKNPDNPGAGEQFKVINEAYEVLSNEITRSIYDSYRIKTKKEGQAERSKENNNTGHSRAPFTKTKKRTYTTIHEKKIYLHGFIEVKFQGEPEVFDAYISQWEQHFKIIPTEVLATITSSSIYRDGPPKEYQFYSSSTDLFKTPLKQPVHCKIVTGNEAEYYQLDLYEVRVKDAKLTDITRHEQISFGTLHGTLLCYVVYHDEVEVTEEYTEYFGPTGQVETKTESGHTFTREQVYAADGSTYWKEWQRKPNYAGKYQGSYKSADPMVQNKTSRRPDLSWLVGLIVIICIWPKLLFAMVPMVGLLLLIALFGWIIASFGRVVPWLGGLAIAMIIILAVRSLSSVSGSSTVHIDSKRRTDSIRSGKAIIKHPDDRIDTVIKHKLAWEDLDSAKYTIELFILSSSLRESFGAHEKMNYQQYASQGIGAVYRSMLKTDAVFLAPIANAFDSLANTRSLDKNHKASMIVSCIQSIPYSLVVEGSCSDNYDDAFVRQYLKDCETDCCRGHSKFGVRSPLEFLSDLKGDCDTRALLLYDILGKLGYKVALLTSNYYKHALIAVQLDNILPDEEIAININGKPYYLWETTSTGFGPGKLPTAISNIYHWNTTLIQ